ncbi:hypothetical protein D030_1790B, partial [Vibrio parahaemolyticus AQ3810]
LTRGIPR